MMVQLYLNNQLCDLYGNETIATDYSIAPISNIASRGSAKSIAFKIPLTANNRAIVENANVIVNATTLPYRFIPAKLKANGLSQGIEFAQIESIKDDISIRLFGSNIDFYSIIKGLKLEDLGDVWGHHWTLANAYASRNNTSGYIYAMIDFHTDSPHTAGAIYIDNTTPQIDVRGLLPCVFLHSIISEIVTQAGFTLAGDFITDADYRSIVIPALGLSNEFNSRVTQTFTAASTSINPLWIEAGFAGVSLVKGSTVTITRISTGQSITLEARQDIVLPDTPVINTFNLVSEVGISSGLTFYAGTDNATDPAMVSGFVVGQLYRIVMNLEFTNTYENGNVIVDYGYDYISPFDVEILGTFTIGEGFDASLNLSYMLPDIKQSDLLKDTAQKFGLIFQVDNANKIVHVRRFSEILDNIGNALDWSEKVDYSEKPEQQFNSDYAQRNLCVYSEDDTVKKPVGTDSEILIDNQNLEAESKLFESPFAASEQVFRFNGHSIAQIKMFTDLGGADEEIADVEPRYLIVRMQTFSPVFTYTDGSTDLTTAEVPLTHFILPGQSFNAGFANNLLDNSADLIALIQEYKLVQMLMRITAADINQLDFFKPVWIELNGQPGCYFYISMIKQFKVTSKESTEVELVKLNT